MKRHKIISYKNLLTMELEVEPIIEGLLDRCESLLICGAAGIGKSILTTNLALYLACPKISSSLLSVEEAPLLFDYWQVPKPTKTLFLQSENSARATKARIEKMIAGNPLFLEGVDLITTPIDRNNEILIRGAFTTDAFRDDVIALIKESKADVVFIDPLISFHEGNENDNGQMRTCLDVVTEISVQTRVATVVVHHVGKSKKSKDIFAARGASAIGDWAHNIMVATALLGVKGKMPPSLKMVSMPKKFVHFLPE